MSTDDTARSTQHVFSRGDFTARRESHAEDAVSHCPNELRPGGDINGAAAIIKVASQLRQHWPTASVEPATYIDGGRDVVVLGAGFSCDSDSIQHFDADQVSSEPGMVLLCW